MSELQTSYRNIVKATSIFGGVQVFTILISMVRTKFVAVLLGMTGVGIINLLNSPLIFITGLTGLGISYSVIRDISQSAEKGDENKLARTIISFRRLVNLTGIIGMIITLILSPLLSKWTFGNSNYTWAFVWLSVTLLINNISAGQKALLQGMRKLQSMAKAIVIGSFVGLLTSVPLYLLYGLKGIVPSIIVTSTVTLLLSWWYAKQVNITKVVISYRETFAEGKEFIKLGIYLSVSSQIGALVSYLIILFIGRVGNLNDVGLYSAGFSFIGTYVGLVFTAMGTDYYPKLAAVCNDNITIKNMANQQATVALLIILPIIILLLIFFPLVTKIFLSNKFLDIVPFVNLAAIGIILKTVSFSIGYISFAKGDSKFFFWLEGIFTNLLNLILCTIGYWLWGLIGVGVAYILLYLVYLIVISILTYKRYDFRFDKDLIIIFLKCFSLILIMYLLLQIFHSEVLYLLETLIGTISISYSFYELNKRINIKLIAVNYFNKLKNR
jgi:O-antigen/teichoic acid export membrane protein